MKSSIKSLVFILVIVGIVAVIALITMLQSTGGEVDEETALCIAQNSKVYTTPTCSVCAAQREILGEHLNKFEVIDCATDRLLCADEGVIKVPTWEIGGQKTTGKKTFEELKELTGC